jgi:hypothetical protein
VRGREVLSGEELAEVEPILAHEKHRFIVVLF